MCIFKRNKIIDPEFIEKEFKEKAKLIHDMYNKKIIISKPLYHYTNFNGLKGILENRELWFTDYNDLNDPTEYKLSLQVVERVIGNFTKRTRYKEFWNRFKVQYPTYEQYYKVYTFSFCESQDYLPAWREYADNGKGFAIGFHQDYFQPSRELPVDTTNQVSIKVLYNDIEFAEYLEKFLKLTDKIYKKYFIPQNISIKRL